VFQSVRQDLRDASLLTKEPANRRHPIACRIHRPQPQVPDAPAGQRTRLQQMLQRQLRGVWVGADAPSDLPRVDLAPWSADEEVEHAARRRAAPKKLRNDRHGTRLQRLLYQLQRLLYEEKGALPLLESEAVEGSGRVRMYETSTALTNESATTLRCP